MEIARVPGGERGFRLDACFTRRKQRSKTRFAVRSRQSFSSVNKMALKTLV